ncbi:hypothetical protein LTR28_011803 [Elasticomyces elasticus]|nr:hypothetical protein LTR28_011803 [Elasticomyces elasticus]
MSLQHTVFHPSYADEKKAAQDGSGKDVDVETAPVYDDDRLVDLGEKTALVPLSGGIIRHADYFVDPAFSFANGWNQLYSYMVSLPAEIVAAAVIIEFWKTINSAT